MTLLRPLPLLAAALFAAGCASLPPEAAPDAAAAKTARGLPDLARGRAAAAEGRLADAEHDLKPLAERGYPLAQTTLARLYAQAGGEAAAEQAQRWYRSALPRVPTADLPLARLLMRSEDRERLAEARELLKKAWEQRQDAEALTGLVDLYRRRPELAAEGEAAALAARAEQLEHTDARVAVIRWYRSTREAPGHAERLVQLCERSLAQAPECYVELARHRRASGNADSRRQLVDQAVAQFDARQLDAPTLAAVARALVEERGSVETAEMPAQAAATTTTPAGWNARSCGFDPVKEAAEPAAATQAASNADPELAGRALQKLSSGDVSARAEAAAVVVRYPYLLPDFELERALKDAVAAQQLAAALPLAQLYIDGQRASRDPQAALELLTAATKRADSAAQAHYLLGRLYQHGFLDEVDPKRALDHLLLAARSGYGPADVALARLFAGGRGLCPDPVAAAVFAALAAQAGDLPMQRLQQQLQARMDKAQVRAANALYQQELAARGAAPKTARASDPGVRS